MPRLAPVAGTRLVEIDSVTPGLIAVARSGPRLAIHMVSGLPGGPRSLLGKRVDPAGQGRLECWPLGALGSVRVAE